MFISALNIESPQCVAAIVTQTLPQSSILALPDINLLLYEIFFSLLPFSPLFILCLSYFELLGFREHTLLFSVFVHTLCST